MTRISSSSQFRLIFLLILLFPLQLFAEPELDLLMGSEDEFLDELPFILSATRLPQPLNEAPVAMTVIDREMIDASGARTIPDLLRLVPGFQVGYFDGNSPVATYHGLGSEQSRRVQVLIDGRSVYVPTLAAIQWSDLIITIEEIDRIEVTRGPNAATYGNNSFLAVVNIFTKLAIEDQGQKIKIISGSQETANAIYRFGDRTENTDYRVTVGKQDDNGTDLLNDYTKASYLSYRVDSQLSVSDQLSYQGGYKTNKKGDHEEPPDFQVETETIFQWLKWDHQTADNNNLSVQYYYNSLKEDLENENSFIVLGDLASPAAEAAICASISRPAADCFSAIDPFRPAAVKIKSERHDLEINYTQNFENLRLVSGVSARLDIVQANDVFRTNDTLRHNLYRLYSHGEYKIKPDWLLNAGFLSEYNDVSGNDFSPRVSLIHHLNENNSVRIGASKATRTPTLFDQNAYQRLSQQLTESGGTLGADFQSLFLDSSGNPSDIINLVDLTSPNNIDSEEIQSLELGFISQLFNKKLTLDIKLFKDEADQLIGRTDQTQPDPDDNFIFDGKSHQVINTAQSTSKGMEISFDYKQKNDFRIYGYYAYIDIEASLFNPLGNDATPRRLEISAPTNTYGLLLIKHWENNFNTSISFFRVGNMEWSDRTRKPDFFEDRSAQPYDKIDIKASKTYTYGKESLKISLILQNLAGDFFDYNKTKYTDASLSTVAPPSSSISSFGSLQDRRTYIEISFLFN